MREPSTMLNWKNPMKIWAKVEVMDLASVDVIACSCRECNEGACCGSFAAYSVEVRDGYDKVVFGDYLCQRCYDIDIVNGLMGCCEFNSEGDITVKSSASRRPYRVEKTPVVTGEGCTCYHHDVVCSNFATVKETVIDNLGRIVNASPLCDVCCDTDPETMIGRCG